MRPLEPTDAFLEPAAGPGENHRSSELVAANERLRLLLDNVGTVRTQAAQLWLSESEAELGWPAEGGDAQRLEQAVRRLLVYEPSTAARGLPGRRRATGLAYLCSSLPDGAGP
jgi:hypothetical protein